MVLGYRTENRSPGSNSDAFPVFLCYAKPELAKANSNEVKLGLGL